MKPEGKVAVVTGAASGLGLETVRTLARAGARVVALDRNAARLEQLESGIGAQVLTRTVDVADEASVEAAIESAVRAFGAVHIAVNCAGVVDAAKTVSRGTPFPLATWNRVISINLTGTFNVIRLAALRMSTNEPDPETGERGVIVNTASCAASQGQIGQAAYSASKAGVIGLTLPAARDLAPLAIRVVSIAPGVFATPMIAGMPSNVQASLFERTLLYPARPGDASEFGALVCHIVENPYLNATTIDLDGGARMPAR